MIVLPVIDGAVVGTIPANVVYTAIVGAECYVYLPGDDVPTIRIDPDPDAALRASFEAEQQATTEAEFAAYKARAGEPSYKAAAVKIAAEKLGLLADIEAAIMALVDKASDKSLYVWWAETDAISRGDAEWQQIEVATEWPKDVTADDLFELAGQI
jgi:hypothetical protein